MGVRQVLSCGVSVPGVLAMLAAMLNGIDLWPEGWVGEVFLGLLWLEVAGVEGVCLCSASEVVATTLAQTGKAPGGRGWVAGFVCGSLRSSGSLQASGQEEEGGCPEFDLTLKQLCWGP